MGGVTAPFADDCSGHSHDTGTAVGAVGGAAIGGLATHSIVGAVVGGVVGGAAGNAVARDNDCEHQAAAEDHAQDRAYHQGYADRATEDRQAYEDRPVAHDDADTVYPDRDNR